MKGRMIGWMGEWMNWWIGKWMNEGMNDWMDEWMNGWLDEWESEWIATSRQSRKNSKENLSNYIIFINDQQNHYKTKINNKIEMKITKIILNNYLVVRRSMIAGVFVVSADILALDGGCRVRIPVFDDEVDGHFALQTAYIPVTEVVAQFVDLQKQAGRWF